MTEPTPAVEPVTAPAPQAQEPAPATAPVETPPWGEDFDPSRAWHTIQSLREREKELTKQPRLTPEQQQQLSEYSSLVEASKSDAQRKDEAAAKATRERDDAIAESLRYKVALKHGISHTDFDLLGSGTEEQLEARAALVAEKNKAIHAAAAAVPTPSPSPRRPGEQLMPGATPPPAPELAEDAYPADWLSPSQRAVLQARNPQ
jgi:hypothetical protein